MEEKGTAETTATETVKHLPTKDEHAFGTHLKEEHSREHRGKTTSTIILTVVFIALLATYIYLHGSDRFDVFQPKPTSSTVQPVPIIPWEDYKKQHPQQSSTPQPSVTSPQPSDSSTPSKTPAEPSPGESTGENGAETRQLFPPVHAPDNNEPSAPPSSPDSAARPQALPHGHSVSFPLSYEFGGTNPYKPFRVITVMIDVQNVSVEYRGATRPALDSVSFQVDKGEFAFIIGPSGSGKSTVLSALLADQKIRSGTITVAGQRVDKLRGGAISRYRRNIGCVFQDYRLLERMTVEENVAFALRVIGKQDRFIKDAVPEALDMVGLAGKGRRFPNELSGGEQQRVAIARAFVNHPLVLLADEPTGNLDRATSDEIVSLLQKINRTGTTILMATHDDRIVDELRQHVIEMRHGKVVRDEMSGVYGRV